MKIGQPSDKSVVSTPAAPTPPAAPPKAEQQGAAAVATQGANSAGVAVTVSTRARALEQANRGASAEINMEKVESVRAAIEQGTYVVNPEVIADKLLADAKDMLNRTRH